MKQKKLKRFFICIFTAIMSILLVLSLGNMSNLRTFAAGLQTPLTFVGKDALEGAALYNATNTYAYKGDNTLTEGSIAKRTYEYYNVSDNGRIEDAQVNSGAPQITVLTHGFGGAASHWSNINYSFGYDEESLISRLNKELSNESNIYWAKMNTSRSFHLFDLKDPANIGSDNIYKEINTITEITDASKHIIVVFEGTKADPNNSNNNNENNTDGYNYALYEEFNYMLSKIVYDVKKLNGGLLPKINLIGHSRGGLTNLQYALEHPDLVASLFSLGTPYFGSDTASTELAGQFASGNALLDIISEDVYMSYYNRWKNGKDDLYKHIDAHALGGYSDTDFVFDALINSDIEKIKNFRDWLKGVKWVVKICPNIIKSFSNEAEKIDFFNSVICDNTYNGSDASWVSIFADIEYWDILQANDLWANVLHNVPIAGCPYFMNDLLVDLPSQLGVDRYLFTGDFYNFKIYAKCFKESDYDSSHPKKLSVAEWPAIVHNLEARDSDFIDYILRNIEAGALPSGLRYKKTGNTSVSVYGYAGTPDSTKIVIPATYNGCTVEAIEDRAFAEYFTDKGVTEVQISSSVKRIGDGAFLNCTELTAVTFSGTNGLVEIGAEAFYGCTNLSQFSFPDSVTRIEDKAFGFSGLSKAVLPSSLEYLGEHVFTGCKKLSSISIATLNRYYSTENGVLFNKAQTTLIHWPKLNSIGSYKMPDSVEEIASGAFYDHDSIYSLDLNNVKIIHKYAFAETSELSSFIADNLEYVDPEALSNSFWNKAQKDDMVKLGKVLISYKGTEANLTLEDVKGIANGAFYGNTTLQSVNILDGLTHISAGAFLNCSSLTTIGIPDTVTCIEQGAFLGCTGLTSMKLPFVGNTSEGTENAYFGFIFGATEATDQNTFVPSGLKTVTVTGGNIGDQAFYNCSMLETVTLKDAVTGIGNYSFYNCNGLTSVTLSNKVTNVGSYAFAACLCINKIEIPLDVSYIGDRAFQGWENDQTICIKADVLVLNDFDLDWYTECDAVLYWEGYEKIYESFSLNLINGGTAYEISKTNISVAENLFIPETYNGLPIERIAANGFKNCSEITNVVIPASIVSIGENAFYGCNSLTKVLFSENSKLETIEGWAFANCGQLKDITLPSHLKTIGTYAFSYCDGLVDVNVPANVTELNSYAFYYCANLQNVIFATDNVLVSIGSYVFYGCDKLAKVVFSENSRLETIGEWAFANCDQLSDITLPSHLKTIGAYAFSYCDGLVDVNVPANVAELNSRAFYDCTNLQSVIFATDSALISIGSHAFYDCDKLAKVVFPENCKLETIGGWAFAYCSQLSDIMLPSDLIIIGERAFYYNINLVSITIPATVTTIDCDAFYSCSNLETVTFAPNSVLENIESSAFRDCRSLAKIELPAGVTSINSYAFYGCTALTEIDIPSSVTNIGQAIFAACTNLTRISVDAENSVYLSDGNCIIRKTDNALVVGCNYSIIPDYVTGIGDDAFYYCRTLTNVTLPDSVTTIGAYAFYNCNALTGIVLPASLSDIGTRVFAYCDQLTAITIPASVVNIGRDAFFRCNKLTQINVHENNSEYSSIDGVLFNKAQSVLLRYPLAKTGSYVVPDSVASIESYAFSECALLESVTFMENSMLANIGEAAFADCSKLETVTFAENSVLTELWSGIFANCNALKSINLPLSVTSIECGAFEYCTGLESIVIPEGVTYMGSGVFSGWTTSQSIYVEADVSVLEYWDANWSDECYAMIYWEGYNEVYTAGLEFSLINGVYEVSVGTSLENGGNTIIIPSIHQGLPVRKIADGGFAGCSELVKVMMVQNGQMMEIGEYAFEGCSALKNINIPEGVRTIQAYAFYGCTSLENIVLPSGLRYLWENAFTGCNQLKSITIADSEVSIADSVFEDCGCTIYAEATSAPTDWLFMELSTNYNIIWNCTLATEDTYVVSIEYTDENIYNSDPLYPPYREGYTFVGWATEEAGEIKYAMEDLYNGNVADGTILYAIWIPD